MTLNHNGLEIIQTFCYLMVVWFCIKCIVHYLRITTMDWGSLKDQAWIGYCGLWSCLALRSGMNQVLWSMVMSCTNRRNVQSITGGHFLFHSQTNRWVRMSASLKTAAYNTKPTVLFTISSTNKQFAWTQNINTVRCVYQCYQSPSNCTSWRLSFRMQSLNIRSM